jgi:hypothetical protein
MTICLDLYDEKSKTSKSIKIQEYTTIDGVKCVNDAIIIGSRKADHYKVIKRF